MWIWINGDSRRASRPARFGGQGHQDSFDITPRLQSELRAAVIQEVELHIPAAAHQLVGAVRIGPQTNHPLSYDLGIHFQKCESHITGKTEIGLPIAAVVIIVEDAASAAGFIAVRQVEILVA